MKPAGGIRTAKQALAYLVMVKETLGDDWLTPDLFRFGASTLVNDVLMQIAKTVDGNYQSADYFSLPVTYAACANQCTLTIAVPENGAARTTGDCQKRSKSRLSAKGGVTRRRQKRTITSSCTTAINCSSAANLSRRSRANISIRSIRRRKRSWRKSLTANARDVDLAVKAARRAYKNVWSKMPGRERGKYLYRIAR